MIWRYVTYIAIFGLITACSESSSRIEIPFVVTFSGEPLACDGAAGIDLTDLRFYVHKLSFIDGDGERHPVELETDDWQLSDLALLDLEDGTGSCLNGTSQVNAVVRGNTNGRDLRGLEFTLGVPFSRNHGDPLKAMAPLGDADMHWHWRGGYKFLRAGIQSEDDSFWIHLGSTGCEGTIQNITGCSAPNRVVVHLDDFSPGDSVAVDLAELVSGGVLDDAIPSDCSSGPPETSCGEPFAAFGLQHATGGAVDAQRIFSVYRRP
ncbi:MAG: MbnP family copper-binding protein [Woeseiaceae bacterium]